jgi:hypothetical protein
MGGGPWQPLDFKCLRATGPRSFEVKIDHLPVSSRSSEKYLPFARRRAKVRVVYRFLKDSTLGLAGGNTIWIAHECMYGRPLSHDSKIKTAIHEAGHFIGMVREEQPGRYVGHDHVGGHCSTGLSAADLAKSSYRGLNGTCVMFGEGASSVRKEFCSRCDPSVRALKVLSLGTIYGG